MARDGNDILREEGPEALRAAFDAAEPFVSDQDKPSFQRAAQIGAESWQKPIEHEKPVSWAEQMAADISLQSYRWADRTSIPRREWLYGRHLVRGFVSTRAAVGGGCKTSLSFVEILAMLSGKPLLGTRPAKPLNIFYWNGEDPKEELQRRIEAARYHHGLTGEDILGRLYMHSGRDMEIKTAISVRGGRGIEIAHPVHAALAREFTEKAVDVAIIDPFISSHAVNENDNAQIDAVVKLWGKLTQACSCATDLLHHLRKTSGTEPTIEDTRGAKALVDGVRDAQLLRRMTKDEAAKMGIKPDEAWRYFRIADGKSNMAPPASTSEWYRLESVDLGNGDSEHEADNVGVVVKWQPRSLFDDIPMGAIDEGMRRVQAGAWKRNSQAKDWVGHALSEVLDLDPADEFGKQQLQVMIDQWLKSGALKVVKMKDEQRKMKDFVTLGNWQFSTLERAAI
jgi:hypothetical protein